MSHVFSWLVAWLVDGISALYRERLWPDGPCVKSHRAECKALETVGCMVSCLVSAFAYNFIHEVFIHFWSSPVAEENMTPNNNFHQLHKMFGLLTNCMWLNLRIAFNAFVFGQNQTFFFFFAVDNFGRHWENARRYKLCVAYFGWFGARVPREPLDVIRNQFVSYKS